MNLSTVQFLEHASYGFVNLKEITSFSSFDYAKITVNGDKSDQDGTSFVCDSKFSNSLFFSIPQGFRSNLAQYRPQALQKCKAFLLMPALSSNLLS